MTARVDHIAIRVGDLDAVGRVLTTMLGFEALTEATGTPRVCYLRVGSLDVELVEDAEGRSGIDHLALGVDSLEEARDDLRRRGLEVDERILAGGRGSRNAWLTDTSLGGVRVHLCERHVTSGADAAPSTPGARA